MRITWVTLFLPFLGSSAFAQNLREFPAPVLAVVTPGVLDVRQLTCAAGRTACADGDGCCPIGAACTRSMGVGLCATNCNGGPTCVYGAVTGCCALGRFCNPTGTLCLATNPAGGGGGSQTSIATPTLATTSAGLSTSRFLSTPSSAGQTTTGAPTLFSQSNTIGQTTTRTTPTTTSTSRPAVTVVNTPLPGAALNLAASLDGWLPRIIGGLVGLFLVG